MNKNRNKSKVVRNRNGKDRKRRKNPCWQKILLFIDSHLFIFPPHSDTQLLYSTTSTILVFNNNSNQSSNPKFQFHLPMGCTSSKLDDLPAVSLCRERCTFLDEAIHQRYSLAASHVAYINSLSAIGHSLNLFIQHDRALTSSAAAASSSPPPSPPPKNHHISTKHSSPSPPHSDSGSHLQFHSDSEDDEELDDDEDHHGFHSHSPSPLHLPHKNNGNYYNGSPQHQYHNNLHMNFMKNKPPPASSIVYEHRPMSNQTVYVGESSSSFYNPYPQPYQQPYQQPYPYNNNSNGNNYNSNYYGYSNPPPSSSFYGSSPPPVAASSKPAPTPPSPPRTSTWDFLNFFESEEKYYPQTLYTPSATPSRPSRDSKEVREEEGIPDLEDEDEVVKQVHGDQKLVDPPNHSHDHGHIHDEEDDESEVEYVVRVVDKKVVDDDDDKPKSKPKPNSAFRPGSRNPLEVAKEIQILFQRASDSGSHIADILEVGKLRYHHKATSKMLHLVAPSLSVVSSASRNAPSADPNNTDLDVELTNRSRNLSSTLHKLYLWEKKLYNEVKAEEKMRVVHDRKCRKLKRLDERGADFNKVDLTRTVIRDLSTKISMAINVVDKISMTINKIRDEELWPQLKGLIQGFNRMWKSMLECHHNQCEAIREARILSSVASRMKSGDSHLQATKQLEQELINWTFQFAGWISAQKGYVRALNNWLLKCLLYEPEETSDGIVPFSPGRIGAPQIFVICNQWSQALDRISEREVVDTMHVFTMSVLHIWEQDKLELHQQLVQNKDLERKVRNIDRDDQKLQKQIQALERKIIMPSGEGKGLSVSENILYQSDKSSNLQASLQRIFEAMERFTDESVRAYEELLQRSEEVSAPRNHE